MSCDGNNIVEAKDANNFQKKIKVDDSIGVNDLECLSAGKMQTLTVMIHRNNWTNLDHFEGVYHYQTENKFPSNI